MSGNATIKRGARKTVRPSKKRTPNKPRKPSALSKLIAAIPFKPQTLQRIATVGTLMVAGGVLIAGATVAGVPQYVGLETSKAIGRAGFRVKRVEVKGIDRMEKLTVYAIALDQHSMAMPLVDLDKVRSQLMHFGWIKDARVSRRLPDTLVVDIIERKPSAVWQHNQQLSLIDSEGVVLEQVALNNMPNLPILVGNQANLRAVQLNQLIERAPSMRPMIASATWVGNRRWDLQFESGETLALPEGEEAAGKSLLRFARMDGVERLLGRGFVRFDMRDPTKFVARVGHGQPSIDKPPVTEGASKGDDKNGPA